MLQEKVLQVIKSKALLDSVKQSNHKFSELELISIAYYFSDTHEQRLNLLKEISVKCKTEAKILADKCIKYLEDSLNAFINPQKDAVYEVHIKDDPQSYDERYLCKTYNGALKIIELFHKCYECESEITDISRFTIYKRLCKDYDTVDEFDEDELGCCELGKGFIIKSVDFWEYHYSNCDKKCEECTDLCLQNITVQYPKFLNEYDIASYINYDLSIQPSKSPVFSRLYACFVFQPYVFSLVFALTSRNKGNFFIPRRPPYPAVLRKYASLPL